MQDLKLIKLLIDKKVLSPQDVSSGLDGNAPCVDDLVASGLLRREQVARALSEYYGVGYVDLAGVKVEDSLFDVLPVGIAHRYQCVPLSVDDETLVVAVSESYRPGIESILEQSSGRSVDIRISGSDAIRNLLEAGGTASRLLTNVSSEFSVSGEVQAISGDKKIDIARMEGEEATVTKLINSLILDALQKYASDIHIELAEHNVITKYRVDGILQLATQPIHTQYHALIISRLKVMAELDIAEKRISQDGQFRLSIAGRYIDFRVSILPGLFGEDVVIRILDKSAIVKDVNKLTLEDLGFDESVTRQLRRAISEPYGMVLITGPTGSGKTTTLYAAISELNDGSQKIITIEDPVECHLEGVVQIPVNNKKQLTFSKGLRSILRHDPDKIMVGEIRDMETAEIAIQSSLTGHLVFSTVHANNVFDVVGRFSHMGIDIYNFVSALNCVMAQRLVRRICTDCKQVHEADQEYLDFSGLADTDYANATWYMGKGCDKCGGTGYRGRTAITEYLKLTPVMRELIVRRQPNNVLVEQAKEDGLITLRAAGLDAAMKGVTSLMEVNRVTFID